MFDKIFGWIMLALNVLMIFYSMVNFNEYGMFVLVFYIGMFYINMRFIEKLTK